MSVNSSSFTDASLLPANLSSSNSSGDPLFTCFTSRKSMYTISALTITHVLLLPLFVLVLFLGYQQWRKRRSGSTATTSHSDLFTFHSIAMQLNEFLGFIIFFCGRYINIPAMMVSGLLVSSITTLGQALFHVLTCVERYLAVVHPITYLRLKQAGGIRVRNICIVCVWLLCFGWVAVSSQNSNESNLIVYFCGMVFFITVTSFCSIAVLCSLKRPGPGEAGGNRQRVDKSKQRAFHTIMVILAALLFGFGGNLISNSIKSSTVLSPSEGCVMVLAAFWFNLPSRLVLPLLFLHRAGKLQCCKQNSESG